MKKILRVIWLAGIRLLWVIRPELSTVAYVRFLRAYGMKVAGRPNYISALVWFDGSDFSKITLGDGITISSNVRILVHDWAPLTVQTGLDRREWMKHATRPISVGKNTFIGTGVILLPGVTIGDRCVIGAGAVVRGTIPDDCVVVGNPAQIVMSTDEFMARQQARSTREKPQ